MTALPPVLLGIDAVGLELVPVCPPFELPLVVLLSPDCCSEEPELPS